MTAAAFDSEGFASSGAVSGPLRMPLRDPCVRLTDARSILEIQAEPPELSSDRQTAVVRLQVRIRTQGLLAQSDLVVDLATMARFGASLQQLGHVSQDIARLEGLGSPSPALIVAQRSALAPAELTILGLTRDARVRFVAQNWQLSDEDIDRLRRWCGDILRLCDDELPPAVPTAPTSRKT